MLRIARYDLVAPVGRDGTAETWDADHRGRQVTVAVAPADEVLLVGPVPRHPNVLTVLEAGRDGGRGWVASERIRARPLSELGRLPAEVVLDLAIQAAAGLDHLHLHRVPHRVPSEDRILVDAAGVVVLAAVGLGPAGTVEDDLRALVAILSARGVAGLDAAPLGSAVELGLALAALRAELPGTGRLGAPAAPPEPGAVPPIRDRTVGRAAELEAATLALATARIVTLVGPGGVGKSRIAREVATRATGSRWADLESCRTLEEACFVVGAAIAHEPGQGEPVAALGVALGGLGPALLVLDGIERVARALAPAVESWCARAPGLRVLSTGRVALDVHGEHRVVVPPLGDDDAADLFALRSPVAPRPEELPAVRALVRALDGLPLAIELCAAQTRGRTLPELIRRRSGELAKVVAVDLGEDLLSPAARQAIGRLAVFEGGIAPSAADAVLDPPDGRFPTEVVDELVEAGVLQADPATGRLSMVRPVRDYADDRMTPEERTVAHRCHGAYFASMGRQPWLDTLNGPASGERWTELLAEAPNLFRAVERALERGDGTVAADAARAVAKAMTHRGPLPALIALLERVVAVAPEDRVPALLLDLGVAVRSTGLVADATRRLEAARAAAERAGDGVTALRAEALLMASAHYAGDFADLDERFTRLVARATASGDRRTQGVLLANWANHHHVAGRRDDAVYGFERAIALLRAAGDHATEAVARANLANAHATVGRYDRARTLYEEAIAVMRATGNRRSEAIAVGGLGRVHRSQRRLADARRCFEQSVRVMRSVGDVEATAHALRNLAELDLAEGRLAEARAALDEALGLCDQAGARLHGLFVLEVRAHLLLAEGDPEAALADAAHARAGFAEMEALDRTTAIDTLSGRAWCALGRRRLDGGDVAGARAALVRARALAGTLQAEAGSDLGVDVTALAAWLPPEAP